MSGFVKKVPRNIGIFGASDHIGGPMARWLAYHSPETTLRLYSSNAAKAARLRENFPDSEVAICDYFDPPSLTEAVDGVEGLFVVCPNRVDENAAMTNLVTAVKNSSSLVHMIRAVGMFPHMNPRRIPAPLAKAGIGLEIQHPIAVRILEDSDLPVTFFNLGASFFDNFIHPRYGMLSPGKVTWPSRRVPMIDPREIGEAAARILLSDNARYIHQFFTLNNNQDYVTMAEMVAIMREELLMDIEHDATREGFAAMFASLAGAGGPGEAVADHLWNFFQFEDANDVAWVLNDFLERTLGRRPNDLRSWIREHRAQLYERLRPR